METCCSNIFAKDKVAIVSVKLSNPDWAGSFREVLKNPEIENLVSNLIIEKLPGELANIPGLNIFGWHKAGRNIIDLKKSKRKK